MTIAASVILDTVRKTTLDGAARAYSDADLLAFLNEAQRSTAGEKTDFYVKNQFTALAAGEVQSLPTDGVELFSIPRNSDANGGRVVTMVARALLAECSRFWPAGTKVAQVEHYTYDPRDPLHFSVFPPNNGGGEVELVYGAVPPTLTTVGQNLVVSDVFQGPLVNYVLAKCYGVNSKKQDLGKFNGYMGQYRQMLGLKTKGQFAMAPKVADVGEAT